MGKSDPLYPKLPYCGAGAPLDCVLMNSINFGKYNFLEVFENFSESKNEPKNGNYA